MVLGPFKTISVMTIPSIHNATIASMLQVISTRLKIPRVMTIVMAIALLVAGCSESQPPAPRAAPRAAPPTTTAIALDKPAIRIVVLGDSLAAGLGLAETDAFPAVVESLLREEGLDVKIVNAGVSGDTTAGGLARIDWVLQQPAEILVVELGGNDALRGQPLENTEKNLREIIRRGGDAGAQVILLGMDVPINYGPDYAGAFAELYQRVAHDFGITLVPGFVRELGSDPTLLQPDGLHPTAEGHRRLAGTLLPTLVEALGSPTEAISPTAPP